MERAHPGGRQEQRGQSQEEDHAQRAEDAGGGISALLLSVAFLLLGSLLLLDIGGLAAKELVFGALLGWRGDDSGRCGSRCGRRRSGSWCCRGYGGSSGRV